MPQSSPVQPAERHDVRRDHANRPGPGAGAQWYAERLGRGVESLEQAISEHNPQPIVALSRCSRLLRGALVAAELKRAARIAVIFGDRGTIVALTVAALRKRGRRLVVLEFLPRLQPPGLRGIAERGWRRAVVGPAIRRTMLRGQAMTGPEQELIATGFGLDRRRIRLIPWARSRTGMPPPAFDADAEIDVFASGRASVDWPCLFTAIAGRPWRVEIACAKADLRLVEKLNGDAGGHARVHCEIPRARHDDLLRSAKVFALVLRSSGPSAGHLRLMAAVDAGTPIVASDVRGLEDYVDAETAVLVPAGDPVAMARALELLLADPERRRHLREAATSAAAKRTYEDYFREVGALLAEGTDATTPA